MSTAANIARQVIHHEIESQIKIAAAKLETLKARAQAAKANVEIKAIAMLLTRVPVILHQLQELQKSTGDHWERAKSDLETRIVDFEKSVDGIEAKIKVH
jgi:hypothetical protein